MQPRLGTCRRTYSFSIIADRSAALRTASGARKPRDLPDHHHIKPFRHTRVPVAAAVYGFILRRIITPTSVFRREYK